MAARLRPVTGEPHTRLKHVALMMPERVAILKAIRKSPGASLTALSRELARHPGTVSGHLHVLHQARLVQQERDGKRLALYLQGELSPRERLMARAGEGAEVLALVEAARAKSPAEVARLLGISRHKARGQLKRLTRMGFIRSVEVQVLVREARYLAL